MTDLSSPPILKCLLSVSLQKMYDSPNSKINTKIRNTIRTILGHNHATRELFSNKNRSLSHHLPQLWCECTHTPISLSLIPTRNSWIIFFFCGTIIITENKENRALLNNSLLLFKGQYLTKFSLLEKYSSGFHLNFRKKSLLCQKK